MWWIHFATRWKINCPLTVGFDGTPKLDPCWKSQTITYKVNAEWKSELNLWTMTILNKLVTDLIDKKYDDNEQETSTTETEVFALKTEEFASASQSKAKAKPWRRTSACSSTITFPIEKELGLMLSQKQIRLSLTQCQINWVLFFVMVIYFEKKMDRLNSGDWKDDLQNKFEHYHCWSDDVEEQDCKKRK